MTRVAPAWALVLALLGASEACAQLSGAYTIDNSQPTANRNFASFADAITALGNGAQGNITFNVYPGTGPYQGFVFPASVSSLPTSSTIQFLATPPYSVAIVGPPAGETATIRIGTTSPISGPFPPMNPVQLSGFAVSGAQFGAGILVTGRNSCSVEKCNVQNCGMGICMLNCGSSFLQDCDVSLCGNSIPDPTANSLSVAAVSILGTQYTRVQRNRVHDCFGNGILVGRANTAGPNPSYDLIVNNAIWNCPGGSAVYPSAGLSALACESSTVSFNSVSMPPGSTRPGILAGLGPIGVFFTQPISAISHNVVRHAGTAACIMWDSATNAGSTLGSTSFVPTTLDWNLYDPVGGGPVGATPAATYGTLAEWRGCLAPLLAGKELQTIVAPAGFVNPYGDLHLAPGSAADFVGPPLWFATDDLDQQARAPQTARGCDQPAWPPLAAHFAVPAVTSGPAGFGAAGLNVSFVNQSYTTDPIGILSYAWDFDGDNVFDSTVANPTWRYNTPGAYSVSLTVTDALNGASTFTRPALIVVQPYSLQFVTTGGGVGDLLISPVTPSFDPYATTGCLLVTFAGTNAHIGSGPMFGITPDPGAWNILFSPPAVGDLLHWVVTPGLFPDVPFTAPSGSLAFLAGVTVDAVQVGFNQAGGLSSVSRVTRVTF